MPVRYNRYGALVLMPPWPRVRRRWYVWASRPPEMVRPFVLRALCRNVVRYARATAEAVKINPGRKEVQLALSAETMAISGGGVVVGR